MTSAVILAGGLGTRLRSVVPDLPKPMAPINHKPFLEHQMSYWIDQGVDHFVLSVGYKHETILEYFGEKFNGIHIDYVVESLPLGTGGGLMLAAKKISNSEKFLLLNGDTYFAVSLKGLIDFSLKNNADWTFSLFKSNEVGRYMGLEVAPGGQISSLQSKDNSFSKLVNGGVYLVDPSALKILPFGMGEKISLENDIFPVAMGLGQRFFGKEFRNTFIDIGVPSDYHRASTLLNKEV